MNTFTNHTSIEETTEYRDYVEANENRELGEYLSNPSDWIPADLQARQDRQDKPIKDPRSISCKFVHSADGRTFLEYTPERRAVLDSYAKDAAEGQPIDYDVDEYRRHRAEYSFVKVLTAAGIME